MITPVDESSIIRHRVPTATGAMIMGIMKMDVTRRAQRLSEQITMATIRPSTSSSATDTTAKRMVFHVLVFSSASPNIRM